MLQRLLFFLLAILITNNLVSQGLSILKFDIRISKKHYILSTDTFTDIDVHIKMKALKRKGVIVPQPIFYGYEGDKDADIIFELFKFDGEKYSVKQRPNGNYNYVTEKQYFTLSYLQSETGENNIFRDYSNITPGKYRIRAKFIVPLRNHYSKKYLHSNWVYFSVFNP